MAKKLAINTNIWKVKEVLAGDNITISQGTGANVNKWTINGSGGGSPNIFDYFTKLTKSELDSPAISGEVMHTVETMPYGQSCDKMVGLNPFTTTLSLGGVADMPQSGSVFQSGTSPEGAVTGIGIDAVERIGWIHPDDSLWYPNPAQYLLLRNNYKLLLHSSTLDVEFRINPDAPKTDPIEFFSSTYYSGVVTTLNFVTCRVNSGGSIVQSDRLRFIFRHWGTVTDPMSIVYLPPCTYVMTSSLYDWMQANFYNKSGHSQNLALSYSNIVTDFDVLTFESGSGYKSSDPYIVWFFKNNGNYFYKKSIQTPSEIQNKLYFLGSLPDESLPFLIIPSDNFTQAITNRELSELGFGLYLDHIT